MNKNKERESVTIDKYVLNALLEDMRGDSSDEKADKEELAKYELVEKILNGNDTDDGGEDWTIIVKRLSDGKFFSLDFQEWDIWWEYALDFDMMPDELVEVFPETVTITKYV